MSLALIAGTGGLPPALLARLDKKPVVCAMDGFEPKVPVDLLFRIEQLGSFLQDLKDRGVSRICMAGAVRRPVVDPAAIDDATMPLIGTLQEAMAKGDDGALRGIIALFEAEGFTVVAATDLAPDLLPPVGVLTKTLPAEWHKADAVVGQACVDELGRSDTGQACIVRVEQVVGREGPGGTAAMLEAFHAAYATPKRSIDPFTASIDLASDMISGAADWLTGEAETPVTADDGILFKAPKPGQDRRADLPLIGLDTAMQAAQAGLAGIVIEAGGVMVLDLDGVINTLDAQGMFLWVRPRGS